MSVSKINWEMPLLYSAYIMCLKHPIDNVFDSCEKKDEFSGLFNKVTICRFEHEVQQSGFLKVDKVGFLILLSGEGANFAIATDEEIAKKVQEKAKEDIDYEFVNRFAQAYLDLSKIKKVVSEPMVGNVARRIQIFKNPQELMPINFSRDKLISFSWQIQNSPNIAEVNFKVGYIKGKYGASLKKIIAKIEKIHEKVKTNNLNPHSILSLRKHSFFNVLQNDFEKVFFAHLMSQTEIDNDWGIKDFNLKQLEKEIKKEKENKIKQLEAELSKLNKKKIKKLEAELSKLKKNKKKDVEGKYNEKYKEKSTFLFGDKDLKDFENLELFDFAAFKRAEPEEEEVEGEEEEGEEKVTQTKPKKKEEEEENVKPRIESINLFHAKIGFDQKIRDVASQIINSATAITSSLLEEQPAEDNIVYKLFNKMKDQIDQPPDHVLKGLEKDDFFNLFKEKEITKIFTCLVLLKDPVKKPKMLKAKDLCNIPVKESDSDCYDTNAESANNILEFAHHQGDVDYVVDDDNKVIGWLGKDFPTNQKNFELPYSKLTKKTVKPIFKRIKSLNISSVEEFKYCRKYNGKKYKYFLNCYKMAKNNSTIAKMGILEISNKLKQLGWQFKICVLANQQ